MHSRYANNVLLKMCIYKILVYFFTGILLESHNVIYLKNMEFFMNTLVRGR